MRVEEFVFNLSLMRLGVIMENMLTIKSQKGLAVKHH
jgi:hypothetical protein